MKVLRSISICLLFLLLYPSSLSSDDGPKVLLINSDAAVEKYEEAGSEFKKALSHPVVEVRLNEKTWKITDVEDLIYDEDPDLVYCIGTKAYLVANKYAGGTNIVFSSIINWMRLPRTEKTYGVSNELHPAMQMMLFSHIFPDVKKIGVLYSKQYNSQWFENALKEAKDMGIDLIGRPVSSSKDNIPALKDLLPGIDALWLISDPVVVSNSGSLMDMMDTCDKNKKPVFSYHEALQEHGATLIVSVDNPTMGRQAGGIAFEVLSEEKIEEKVQYPAGSHIILNLKKVKEYGLTYNEEALASVNTVIE